MEAIEQIEQKPIKKKGGARPNSGPKLGAKYKKTIAREAAVAYLTRRIEEKIEPLADKLIDLALTGDVSAMKETLERGLGKVKDVHKLEGELKVSGVEISFRE